VRQTCAAKFTCHSGMNVDRVGDIVLLMWGSSALLGGDIRRIVVYVKRVDRDLQGVGGVRQIRWYPNKYGDVVYC
jgi:hypothetical protein